jgi:low affinity Fe/Cu permease
MKKLYRHTENGFERLATYAIAILGNSITFILAVGVVLFWLTEKEFYKQDVHNSIGDILLGIAFLSLFIIQKSFNRFSASMHVKLNELVASHEPASNAVIDLEGKTEHEITELSREYAELAAAANEEKLSDTIRK